MIFTSIVLSTLLLVAPLAVVGQTGPGPCHPYPGAVPQDCLELIGGNLNNDTQLACDSTGSTTLNLRQCSIVTKCASGQTTVEVDAMVRRSLTTIGACALSDYGSISGYFNADDGSKTCYLYPTAEGSC